MAKRTPHKSPCPVEAAITVFGGKWKPAILYYLENNGPMRFSDLRRIIPEISPRMLTLQLRELERNGLVHREQFPEVPPHVEYSLTKLGESLKPVFKAIERWRQTHMGRVTTAQLRYDEEKD